MPEIRIIQWREFGDDDDTVSIRVVLPGDEIEDSAWICDVYSLAPDLGFEDGGITIIETIHIRNGDFSDEGGKKVRVTLE
jgi:hypothetical protein